MTYYKANINHINQLVQVLSEILFWAINKLIII